MMQYATHIHNYDTCLVKDRHTRYASTAPTVLSMPRLFVTENRLKWLGWQNRIVIGDLAKSFRERLAKKKVVADARVQEVSRQLAGAFASCDITAFDVDFGRAFRAITFIVQVNGIYELMARIEADDPDETVVFSISRNDVHFYTGSDHLNSFGHHVQQFFATVNHRESELEYGRY